MEPTSAHQKAGTPRRVARRSGWRPSRAPRRDRRLGGEVAAARPAGPRAACGDPPEPRRARGAERARPGAGVARSAAEPPRPAAGARRSPDTPAGCRTGTRPGSWRRRREGDRDVEQAIARTPTRSPGARSCSAAAGRGSSRGARPGCRSRRRRPPRRPRGAEPTLPPIPGAAVPEPETPAAARKRISRSPAGSARSEPVPDSPTPKVQPPSIMRSASKPVPAREACPRASAR